MHPDCSRTRAAGSADVRRGRILRLKSGYNPNSSSMGSIVFALPLALLGASVLFGAATAAIFASLLERGSPSPHGEAAAAVNDDDAPGPAA
jgi:hypothetical protein